MSLDDKSGNTEINMRQIAMSTLEILVVDDTPESLRLLADLLRSNGYEVRPTTSPNLALSSAIENPPDLALLDVTMPEMDGFELCRHLKENPRTADVPVIFISALHEVADRLHGFEVGGVDFITKPIEKEIVLARVNTHLHLAKTQQDLQHANAELASARDRAEAANHAKSLFLANISHELRTPLSAILGFSEVLEWDATPEQMDDLRIINQNGEHLLTMINDVLDLSKIEAGHLELQPVVFNLLRMLQDIAHLFQLRTESAELNFKPELELGALMVIKADLGKLRQILINLLGNAIKFTSEGCITLHARTYELPHDPELSGLEIEVIDSGPGIDEEQLPHIFEPFYQAGHQTEQTPSALKGTGLGLAITKSLVELMSGTITVKSKVGKGSCFKVNIPVVSAENTKINVKKSLYSANFNLVPKQPTWRILTVEDDPDARHLVSSLLNRVGFEHKEASSGKEAIALFDEWQPHLIFMDIRMPEMDGYEATRRIRQRPGGDNVKIVVLTACVIEGQHQQIQEAGCDGILHKPFRSYEIYQLLEQYLGVQYQNDERGYLSNVIADSPSHV